ncbi:hypothetical protein HK099_008721 [Clydaea vesicula]|uniref:Uncharacterized protein n=1 Tax=Clydaea vesicula TaxID=447962 RepID=A0AAD5XT07_9FUNG|nr:hypothetical protein HK099_008721 [Clydaea vesicula]
MEHISPKQKPRIINFTTTANNRRIVGFFNVTFFNQLEAAMKAINGENTGVNYMIFTGTKLKRTETAVANTEMIIVWKKGFKDELPPNNIHHERDTTMYDLTVSSHSLEKNSQKHSATEQEYYEDLDFLDYRNLKRNYIKNYFLQKEATNGN